MDLKKMMKVMLVCLFTVFLFAYQGQAATERGFDDKEIRIAAWAPQTGPAAPWGAVARGSKLYFDIVNEEGGINGRKIKFFVRDDQYNPSQTVAGVKELVERYGIFAFVGGVGTACCQSVYKFLLENKIIWISPCSGARSFYDPFNPYLWNIWISYENDASILAKFAVEKKKYKKIAMLYNNDDYGLDSLDSVKYRLSKYKLELVAALPVEPTERDLSSQVAKLKASGAEAVIGFCAPTQAAIALRTSVSQGFRPQWIHSYNLSDYPLMNKITDGLWSKEGVITSAFFVPPFSDHPLIKKYHAAQQRLAPTERWGIFYQAGIVVAEPLAYAMKKVGTNLSTAAVKNELDKITNFQGVGPKISWKANDHRASRAVQVWQCDPKGEIVVLQDWTENEISRY
jgi:branched-chain amino acid transport system substrate-binding protein